ncbi:4a-hydroxytetrahydrobiopterin dehydratase [Candidatus Gracilibacteria bacterium]|nr:4a-hydroxytetrahydrobiopterin dehydratase [Candidatus Gracilibacteria bacterium]
MFVEINNRLEKEFEFNNFQEALDFTNRVGKLAEEKSHHPDIFIHSYKKVKITLFTHSKNKITTKDYNLAEEIETLI